MRAIICGGRDYDDLSYLKEALARINAIAPISRVICGMALGADTMGRLWARQMGIQVEAFYPDWKGQGKSAGIIRNREMLEHGKPDLVIAFPGGRGTDHMTGIARAAGVPVIQLDGHAFNAIDEYLARLVQ